MATKILLVEDDTNLSEIYKARLEAEGFAVSSAEDGEAALAMAVKEHPDLIISDVMMPKISGFDMLDILRGTDGVKDTRVIMMTALSQAEDKVRADKLGADRYLVKSQVTLEDVIKVVHEVLEGDSAQNTPAPVQAAPEPVAPVSAPVAEPVSVPVTAAPVAEQEEETAKEPIDPSLEQTSEEEQSAVISQIQDFVDNQEAASQKPEDTALKEGDIVTPTAPEPPTEPKVIPVTTMDEPKDDTPAPGSVPIAHKKVIAPLNNVKPKKDINQLLAEEEGRAAVEGGAATVIAPENPTPGPEDDPNNIAL